MSTPSSEQLKKLGDHIEKQRDEFKKLRTEVAEYQQKARQYGENIDGYGDRVNNLNALLNGAENGVRQFKQDAAEYNANKNGAWLWTAFREGLSQIATVVKQSAIEVAANKKGHDPSNGK